MHRVLRRTKHDDVFKVDVTAKMCSSIVILCALLALTSAIEDTLGIISYSSYNLFESNLATLDYFSEAVEMWQPVSGTYIR